MKKNIITAVMLSVLLSVSACSSQNITGIPKQKDYGVFIGATDDLEAFGDYKTVVIDAAYFDEEEIKSFKESGHKVYSYINVGSLEDFRDYYDDYKDLGLGKYEHWDEEIWIDVSDERWQDFILNDLAKNLSEKGIDGFFVDNCDVYYLYPTPEMLEGLTLIMQGLKATGSDVVINGGDAFMDAYLESGGKYDEVITGINQESVFSKILWDKDRFSKASKEDKEYFTDYIERYSELGADIYLLEYTTDEKLIKEIDEYCRQKGYFYYVSDSLKLN
ncbi:MAG: endo alpha-1,4 polygalactosaminidase [Lachnospiraceae bacterium]|nr:endo alpha-1,4 polygalactosaminidase [Lachnospiraceae bacterium]